DFPAPFSPATAINSPPCTSMFTFFNTFCFPREQDKSRAERTFSSDSTSQSNNVCDKGHWDCEFCFFQERLTFIQCCYHITYLTHSYVVYRILLILKVYATITKEAS